MSSHLDSEIVAGFRLWKRKPSIERRVYHRILHCIDRRIIGVFENATRRLWYPASSASAN